MFSTTIGKVEAGWADIESINGYSEELTVKQYVRAVLRMLDKYMYFHSEEEYEKEWRHPFPLNDLEKLRECYRKL